MIATKEINGKEQSKWIVESTHLRKMSGTIWNEALASQPTIKRGDSGQWKEGDVLTEGVDFEKVIFCNVDDKKCPSVICSTTCAYKVAIPKQQESEETFTFSEDELYSIISRSQAHALKEDWLTPAEVLKKIKAEYKTKLITQA